MSIDLELVELEEIRNSGFALIQYAISLPENTNGFSKKGERWICNPNFVTFQIHHKRVKNLRISLRGNPDEFQQYEELPLKAGMSGYSECSFVENSQLFAAATYIRRAWQIFTKGRSRIRSAPKTIGEY